MIDRRLEKNEIRSEVFILILVSFGISNAYTSSVRVRGASERIS